MYSIRISKGCKWTWLPQIARTFPRTMYRSQSFCFWRPLVRTWYISFSHRYRKIQIGLLSTPLFWRVVTIWCHVHMLDGWTSRKQIHRTNKYPYTSTKHDLNQGDYLCPFFSFLVSLFFFSSRLNKTAPIKNRPMTNIHGSTLPLRIYSTASDDVGYVTVYPDLSS
jgi:hypothetical protein